VTSKQDEHEARFVERKRRVEAARALKHIAEGSKPLDTEEFVQAIGGELREGEDTYQARNRIKARVAELSAKLTEDSPEEDVKEFLHLHRFACQSGGCWSKARKRWRADRGDAIPTVPWGNEDDMNARRKAKREARQAREKAREDRLAELEAAMAAIKKEAPATPYIDLSERPDAVEEVVGPLEALKAKIDAVRAGQQDLTPDELLQMYRDDPPGAAAKLEDAVRALKGEARRKLSELLNVELAELKNLRGMAGEDRTREQQIEYLLGLFTRLGEI